MSFKRNENPYDALDVGLHLPIIRWCDQRRSKGHGMMTVTTIIVPEKFPLNPIGRPMPIDVKRARLSNGEIQLRLSIPSWCMFDITTQEISKLKSWLKDNYDNLKGEYSETHYVI